MRELEHQFTKGKKAFSAIWDLNSDAIAGLETASIDCDEIMW